MAALVKICGINTPEAADAALRAGADFAGLMLHARSPRNIGREQAAQLAAQLRGRARIVTVLVDPDDEALAAAVAAAKPDFIQLHGRETPERVAHIRDSYRVGIIKVIPVADASDLADVARYETVADMLMFDAKAPGNAGREGGLGTAFDWAILQGRSFVRPWFLAGGLNPDNVARAIRMIGAPGVDVSSGVESAPGRKSPELIAAFVAAARRAQYAIEAEA